MTGDDDLRRLRREFPGPLGPEAPLPRLPGPRPPCPRLGVGPEARPPAAPGPGTVPDDRRRGTPVWDGRPLAPERQR